MALQVSRHVKKTITLPIDLVETIKTQAPNMSAFIAEACREKLKADAKKAREQGIIERCRVRADEDRIIMEDFKHVDQEAWDLLPE